MRYSSVCDSSYRQLCIQVGIKYAPVFIISYLSRLPRTTDPLINATSTTSRIFSISPKTAFTLGNIQSQPTNNAIPIRKAENNISDICDPFTRENIRARNLRNKCITGFINTLSLAFLSFHLSRKYEESQNYRDTNEDFYYLF